jgi:hypothetical protein
MITTRLKLLALAAIAATFAVGPSAAITADVARKCDALVAQRFPPRLPGNPAAGSAKGSAADQRTFFQRCVANGGKADDGEGTHGNAEAPKQ